MSPPKFKIPTTSQPFTVSDRAAQSWYRYLVGIEDVDTRLTPIETQDALNTNAILALTIRMDSVEAGQNVQDNRLDDLEVAVYGGAGGTGQFGDGFGAGFEVS